MFESDFIFNSLIKNLLAFSQKILENTLILNPILAQKPPLAHEKTKLYSILKVDIYIYFSGTNSFFFTHWPPLTLTTLDVQWWTFS